MHRKIIPDIVQRLDIASVKVDDTVFECARVMVDAHISALVVLDGNGILIGIITERDLTQRILAAGLDGKTRREFLIAFSGGRRHYASFLYLIRCGWSALTPSSLRRNSSYSEKLPSNHRTWLSPSKART